MRFKRANKNPPFQVPKKQETSKQVQTSVQKLLEPAHSDRTLDSRIHNSSINFILKGFPVTPLPELSARSQAIISSVTSNWVFICQILYFTDASSLAFLCSQHNRIMRTVTHTDLSVPQPFAGSKSSTIIYSDPKPNTSPHLLFFSWIPKGMRGRKTSSSKTSSFQGRLNWMWAAWAVPQAKQYPWCIHDSTGLQMCS